MSTRADDVPSLIDAAVSPLFQRAQRKKRERKPAPYDERLVEEALQAWLAWLLAMHLPRGTQVYRASMQERAGTVYETFAPFVRVQTSEINNPTLLAVLADERHGHAWPKTIHALIVDLPQQQRLALLGSALGFSHERIGEQLAMPQQRACETMLWAKCALGGALRALIHVRRAHASTT